MSTSVESVTQQEETANEVAPAENTPATGDNAETTGNGQNAEADTTGEATSESSKSESSKSESSRADSPKADSPKRGRAKGTAARKTRTVELTLTVTGTADGEWQAELKHGSKWVARGLDIPAAAVSRAAKELHVDLSGPIDEVINAALEQQQAKVAELEAELERAKQALADLES